MSWDVYRKLFKRYAQLIRENNVIEFNDKDQNHEQEG